MKITKSGLSTYFSNHIHLRGIIVCPERKFIYMKATKTAGTSVLRGVLEPKISGIIHQKDYPNEFQTWLDGITDEILEEYFIFTIVRNPWDRMVSIASYFEIELSEFLQRFDHFCEDERIRIHSLPLHYYSHNNGQQFADYICRFETLQQDMNHVFDQIDLPQTQLPFMNPSDHLHYSTYYGPNEIDLVSDLFQIDIAYYGYTFNKNA